MFSAVLKIAYSKDAVKTLSRMPTNLAGRIRDKIREYAAEPASQANNVTRLQGRRELYRLRVGDWRVIFMLDHGTVEIVAIGPRGGIYDQ